MLSITVIGLDKSNRWIVESFGKVYTVPFHGLEYGTWAGEKVANPDTMKP